MASVALAVAAMTLVPCIAAGNAALSMVPGGSPEPRLLAWLLPGGVDIAALALGLACAARLSKNKERDLALAGIVFSALVLIGCLAAALAITARP